MPTETQLLESLYFQAVRDSLEKNVGLFDQEITGYVAHTLCEFAEPDGLSRLREEKGQCVETIQALIRAADPVYGTAPSFDAERSMRKYIGDYALCIVGMHLDVMESGVNYQVDRAIVDQLIQAGRESYFIVSQFDVFEFEKEAPMFRRLAECLDRCILGLALIREQLVHL
jgi:hypothetical protein